MKIKNFLGLALLGALWGPTFLLIKIGVETVSPLALTTVRVFSAAVFLILYCLITSRSFKQILPYWKDFLFMAIFGNVIPFLSCAWAETMVQSSTAGIIEGSVPVLTAILSVLFSSHRSLPKEQVWGIVLGFIGILVIFAPDLMMTESNTTELFFGKFLLMIMALSFAISFVFSKERLEDLPHIGGVALQMVMATLILFPATVVVEGWNAFEAFTYDSLGIVLMLGIYGTAFPWCVYFYLIKRGSATQVSFAVYLLPVIAIVLGIIFLSEELSWNLVLGTAIILASLLLAGEMLSTEELSEHDNPILRS